MYKSFNELMTSKGLNGNQLAIKSGLPVMTVNDLKNAKTEFRLMTVQNAIKISNAFDMTVEEVYQELYTDK